MTGMETPVNPKKYENLPDLGTDTCANACQCGILLPREGGIHGNWQLHTRPLKNPRFFVLKAGGYKFIHKMTHGRFLMTGNIKLARGKGGAAAFTPSWAPPALRFSLR